MKYLGSQLSYLLTDGEARRNLKALARYLIFVLGVILVYTVVFHVLMLRYEDQDHTWLTGFYWTLTVMSTLGFGDITFHTDIGRLFSIIVLLSGIVLLLIMLPFAFIRYFYAPWLEAQLRSKVPRSLPPATTGHVIICRWDSIAPGLVRKLSFNRIPHFVLEPDPVAASRLLGDGVSVVNGEIDSQSTYERLRITAARMLIANDEDMTNTNITLTVRATSADVPICALAEDNDSVDILELSGADTVLPLKRRLGEHLAARVTAGSGSAHVVGRFKDLAIFEFVVHDTEFVGKTLKQSRFRELTGINVVGIWEQGRLGAVDPSQPLSPLAVPVAVGTAQQVAALDRLLGSDETSQRTALVIGGGKVGRATAASLELRGLAVRVVEKDPAVCGALRREFGDVVADVVAGDAADRSVLLEAGLENASAVALTTNDDAVNIHLAVYCRRLKPDLNIVSRITHERNIEAIYRAGADSALSYSSLGREYLIARLLGREPVMVGEGADFFHVPVPPMLVDKTLGESGIGAATGLVVIAVEEGEHTLTNPRPETRLAAGACLLVLGTTEQRQSFAASFE